MRPEKQAIEISRREVLNNIIRFKDALFEDQNAFGGESSYPVLLNARTGDLRFAQKMSSLENGVISGRKPIGAHTDWKKVQLHIARQESKVCFEFTDETNHSLPSLGFEPLAWRVAQETLQVLNDIVAQHRPMAQSALTGKMQEVIQAALKDLSQIRLSTPKGQLEHLPGWRGTIDRITAETELKNAFRGSYLLREGDADTQAIAFYLSEANRTRVRAYLCTVAEAENKISDILLLQLARGWTLYHDNPNLFDEQYVYVASPHGLLAQINHRARHPLK
ncbi:MAG TPA: hypothetical protein VGM34_03545 [Chlamydiales bacterium]|jgi:hypothetical protein